MTRRTLPPAVLGRARAAGAAGEAWLAGLDGLVEEFEKRWNIRAGEALTGGTAALAALAEGPEGQEYVLRIAVPGDKSPEDFASALRAMELSGGRGGVRLLRAGPERQACLLERLGPRLSSLQLPPREQMDRICEALERYWIPVEDEPLLHTGADAVQWFRGFLPGTWEALGRPCPKGLVDWALDLLAQREAAFRPEEWVLCHGDANADNLLEVPGEPGTFRLIDPDGLAYEKAYDLGVMMREWTEEYADAPVAAARARAAYLAERAGAPEEAVWQWGCLQCVSTALVCLTIGMEGPGRRLLALAEAWRGEA